MAYKKAYIVTADRDWTEVDEPLDEDGIYPNPIHIADDSHAHSADPDAWLALWTDQDSPGRNAYPLELCLDGFAYWLIIADWQVISWGPFKGRKQLVCEVIGTSNERHVLEEMAEGMAPEPITIDELFALAPGSQVGGYRGGGRKHKVPKPVGAKRRCIAVTATAKERQALYALIPEDSRERYLYLMEILQKAKK